MQLHRDFLPEHLKLTSADVGDLSSRSGSLQAPSNPVPASNLLRANLEA